MDKVVEYQNEILQVRAEATKLNALRHTLRKKMEEAGLSGATIRRAIGFSHVEIDYVSEYEEDMYQVWLLVNQNPDGPHWSVQEVDSALMRTGFSASDILKSLRYQTGERNTLFVRRFYDELTGIILPDNT